ncbi:hypothetical protein KCTC32516_02292 [Polaribacter huanghezhanensis]|uniref:hypothetical protein n=1 Tax=Polaribacter huanghezhanensis TaxID=1354726 RepID=UPI00264969AC|nr:hypothetical protein [Polaribacter huanghezhanensis]WKD86912.1 hypothetical protein KCTC32516_02292 [Polaribacter huanghezhanensis]
MDTKNKYSLEHIKSTTQNKSGFSTPENYFDSVEDAVFSEIRAQSFSKENAFTTPKNYFENFEDSLFTKIDFPQKEVKVISLKSRLLQIIPAAAAASVLLFIGLNYFTFSDTTSFDSISSEDLENWLDDSYINDASSTVNFVDADFKDSNALEEDASIKDEDILEYLNTIDNTALLTEIES